MNVYSVDAHGNVVAAAKVVQVKMNELMIAQENLIIARIFAGRTLPDSNPTPVVKPVKKHRASSLRKMEFLWEYQRSSSEAPSLSDISNLCKILAKTSKKFFWCKDASANMQISLFTYCITNF